MLGRTEFFMSWLIVRKPNLLEQTTCAIQITQRSYVTLRQLFSVTNVTRHVSQIAAAWKTSATIFLTLI